MVAYSSQKMFAPQVESLTKLHTVRAPRKRHARVSEAVQLYTGMRTRACRKLVTPDPICTRLDDIRLEIGEAVIAPDMRMGMIEGVEINGRQLADAEIETFALADGFAPLLMAPAVLGQGWVFPEWVTARLLMGDFWKAAHGTGGWQGVVVHWNPEPQ